MKLKESETEQVETPDFCIIHIFYFDYPEGYLKFANMLIVV